MNLLFVVTLSLVRGYQHIGSIHFMQDAVPDYMAHRRLQYEYFVNCCYACRENILECGYIVH